MPKFHALFLAASPTEEGGRGMGGVDGMTHQFSDFTSLFFAALM